MDEKEKGKLSHIVGMCSEMQQWMKKRRKTLSKMCCEMQGAENDEKTLSDIIVEMCCEMQKRAKEKEKSEKLSGKTVSVCSLT